MKLVWNRLLVFLRLRGEYDYAPNPFPAVPHAYDPELNGRILNCCAVCGGGPKIAMHKTVSNVVNNPPYPMVGRPRYPRPEKEA